MKATFLKGVALGAAVSLATLMATAAFAGTGVGGVLNLGAVNTVNAGTGLSGSTNGNMLGVRNLSTAASAGGIGISGVLRVGQFHQGGTRAQHNKAAGRQDLVCQCALYLPHGGGQ